MRSETKRRVTLSSMMLLGGLTIVALAPSLRTLHTRGIACLLCVWLDIPPWVRTAIGVVTSLDAIGGAIGAAAGERIGGAFGRGFGRKLGERVGSGDLVGLATGGTGVITGAQSLGGWGQDQAVGKIKGGLKDKGLEFLFGDDKASRQQEAMDWFDNQVQRMSSD